MRVPLADLAAQHRAIASDLVPAVLALVEAQTFILGEPVARFERTLARIAGTTHAVGVASGTDAIALSLRALGIGPGDAVLTSAFSFVASAGAIASVGARPMFADIDGFNLSPASVEVRLATMSRAHDGTLVDEASGARLRAILAVHLFGECADVDALGELAARHHLHLVEDAAQAIGARSGDRRVGGFGAAAAFSFFPSKNLGAWGDGGAVTTSDGEVAARVRSLRVHGRAPGARVHAELGTNSRLDALQATVLDVKAPHLEAWTTARARAAERYRLLLRPLEGKLELPPPERAGSRHVYNQFVVRTRARDALAAHLAKLGVETRAYYPLPLHREPCFAPFVDPALTLPRAEEAARAALAIPIYPEITEAQQAYVADAISSFGF